MMVAALLLGLSPILHAQTGEWQLVPSNAVPQFSTFWSMQRTNYPPLPFLPYPELNVYWSSNTPDWYFYDDLALDYDAMIAQWRLTNAVSQLQSR